MTTVKDKLLEFNSQVEWAPDWVGEGRFGEWLRNVKDWAISREFDIGELHFQSGFVVIVELNTVLVPPKKWRLWPKKAAPWLKIYTDHMSMTPFWSAQNVMVT